MIRFFSASFVVLASMVLFSDIQAQGPGTFPKDWGGGPVGTYEVKTDQSVKHDGNASVSLKRVTGQGGPNFGTIVQAFKADDYRGKRLRLTGHVKSADVKDRAGLWVRVDSDTEGTVAFDNMQDRPIKGTTDLKKYEIVLQVPEKSALITFGALLSGEGQIWIDDFKFETVGAEVNLTAKEMKPIKQEIKVPQDLRKEPSNLSFEM